MAAAAQGLSRKLFLGKELTVKSRDAAREKLSVPRVVKRKTALTSSSLADKTHKQGQQVAGTTALRATLAEQMVETASQQPGASPTMVYLPQGNSWSVHKFGGTCVASWERILNVANIVANDASPRRLVVVSAMSKVTNSLYALLAHAVKGETQAYLELLEEVRQKHIFTANQLLQGGGETDLAPFLEKLDSDVQDLKAMLKAISIAGNATQAFSDYVVGHGELWSAQMLSATVRKITKGPCAFLDAREVLVVRPAASEDQVDPIYDRCQANMQAWYEVRASEAGSGPDMIVATGFIARDEKGIQTTLKRDGSDLSAAIFASLVRAKKCTIWTDVDGVYSADPRKVPDAVILKSLSYQEAWEMSYFGAKVLHPRTALPVMRYGIPMFIRNALNPTAPGTRIGQSEDGLSDVEEGTPEEARDEDESVEEAAGVFQPVKAVATIDKVAIVNVEGTGMAGVPGTASQIFSAVKSVGANVMVISQASSEHSVCFVVPEGEADMVADALRSRFARAIESGDIHQIGVVRHCTILAAVGQRMASTPGVSAALFSALAKAGVNVRAIAQGCSEYNITVVVDSDDSSRALKAAHARFYNPSVTLGVVLIGPGLIGSTLLEQLREQAPLLVDEFGVEMKVVGIVSSSSMLLDGKGLDLSKWKDDWQAKKQAVDFEAVERLLLDGESGLRHGVMVDCTASDAVPERYASWLGRGIHVVTPNKKASSGPLGLYRAVHAATHHSRAHFFYEAAVGAGLPVICSLQSLRDTGDKVKKVEGIFSGTLSYIFNSFDGSKPFSAIVAEAKAAGYTEPDPREDLAGMDVARKVVILAREAGLHLQMEDVSVTSLVPEPLRAVASVEEFMQKLPAYDEEMEQKRQEAAAANEVLRYVGVVDTTTKEAKVELRRYPTSHAFAQLTGSDNIILFSTSRYVKQPLIIRGPGAGAEVTAGGVFSDLLRLCTCVVSPL